MSEVSEMKGQRGLERPQGTAGSGRMTKKKLLLVLAAGICALSWVVMGVGLAIGVSKTTGIILVSVAAVATEALFWVGALVLGVSVVQSRRQILGWLRLKMGI